MNIVYTAFIQSCITYVVIQFRRHYAGQLHGQKHMGMHKTPYTKCSRDPQLIGKFGTRRTENMNHLFCLLPAKCGKISLLLFITIYMFTYFEFEFWIVRKTGGWSGNFPSVFRMCSIVFPVLHFSFVSVER